MAVNSPITMSIGIGVAVLAFVALPATANPLCASPEQRRTVQSTLIESPKLSPAKIASATGIPEAAVVQAMPMEARTAVSMLEFERVWQGLIEWEDALIVVPSSHSVFEIFGRLPEGEIDRGYFNFDGRDSAYGGHLKVDRLAAIYFLSTESENGETHQVAFYDLDGRRVFSVYVPRDDKGVLQTQPHSRFLRMKRDFGALATHSLLTDASCMWRLSGDQNAVPVEDRN